MNLDQQLTDAGISQEMFAAVFGQGKTSSKALESHAQEEANEVESQARTLAGNDV